MDQHAVNEVARLLGDRRWRLNNLYWIEDKHGQIVKFNLNAAQSKLLDDLHYLNLILKARQMGFSTFILILALDCSLFNSNFDAGLVADTKDNAIGLLRRIKFAYDRLPDDIKLARSVTKDSATELHFSNNSSIEVGVSLRSSTKNFLHVSEYGKICAKSPDKAKEIRSGTLNTLAQRQLGFIESTAEGRGGDFYTKTSQAQAIADEGRPLTDMEWRFHFFPWYQDETYQTGDRVRLTEIETKYFSDLQDEHGIDLTDNQKHWYALKWREQGDDMLKEYPSTPAEAFAGAKDGSYFGGQITALRRRKCIGAFPFETRTVVNTFWDLGVSDMTSIWLHQEIAGKHRFVGFYENSGEGIEYYINWLDKWRVMHGATFGRHFAPHDVEHRRLGLQAKSIKQIAQEVGFKFEVVSRTLDKQHSIQNCRSKLPECEFDDTGCSAGIVHLENYSKEWDDKNAVWKLHPRHDEHSHGADAFMVFSDGYISPPPKRKHRPTQSGSWLTA